MPKRTLKGARVDAGYTQADAAAALNIAVSTLRNWESGKTFPKQSHIEMLCALYGVSYDHINFNVNM